METRVLQIVLYAFLFVHNALSESSQHERQKRCIVIQKQSGSHGDSTEGDDEDYRRPQPVPKADKSSYRPLGLGDRKYETEEIPPELQRLRKRFDRLRLKKTNRHSDISKTGAV